MKRTAILASAMFLAFSLNSAMAQTGGKKGMTTTHSQMKHSAKNNTKKSVDPVKESKALNESISKNTRTTSPKQ
jgi:hypothetical protein